jgi:hypothetical protein
VASSVDVPASFLDKCGKWSEPDALGDVLKYRLLAHLEHYADQITGYGKLPEEFFDQSDALASSSKSRRAQ